MKTKIKAEQVDYILIVIANFALALIFIFGNYRLEWFGVIPGYAPYNFAFNVGVILPLTFISVVISILVFFKILLSWKKRKNKLDNYFFVFFLYQVLF
jgi:uncharacterized membrane protein